MVLYVFRIKYPASNYAFVVLYDDPTGGTFVGDCYAFYNNR